jgi:hypothetical protein
MRYTSVSEFQRTIPAASAWPRLRQFEELAVSAMDRGRVSIECHHGLVAAKPRERQVAESITVYARRQHPRF